MALNGISTLMIASGSTLTKNANPPYSNTEIVLPYSAIWSVNYTGALGATNSVSYKLYVTSLGIGSALTLTSHQTGDYAVTAGNFLYDEYGNSLGIIKGNATIDNYMAKAAAVCGSLSNTIITAATYKGTWNAFSDTPTLIDGVGTLGDAYDVDTAGTSGAYPAYGQQDWRIYDGSAWVRVDKTTTTQWTITPAASGLADKEARQKAKLDLASSDRLAVSNTRVYYDITQLPTQYSGNDIVDNPNTDGLVAGRPWITSQVYTGLTFTYGQATISFTLTNGVFSNVTCPYGAGGYSASSGQLTMPGNQLIGGTSPANDIVWNYVCAANNGVITGFTYSSGNPWTGSYSIVTSGQLLYIDAGDTSSYSGSGPTWTDLSTYQNDATLTNSPSFTSAGTASYFSFNGTNQYAPVTTSKMNVAYTGKTTMFSIKTVSANTGNGIYRNLFGGDGNARNFNTYMYHVSGNTWQMQFSTGPNSPWAGPISSSFTVTDNGWIVVAVTQTTSGVVTYYVNGQQIGTPATGITFSQFINSGIEAVGRSDNYWRGDMGVCAVYGRALNAIQIQQNFNALRGRYGL
jgi:hypothetical protein